MIKVVSIIMIIFGALAVILAIIGLLGAAALGSMLGAMDSAAGLAAGGIMAVGIIFACAAGILEFITGIVGVKNANKPEKATALIVLSVIIILLVVVNIIMSGFDWTSILGFVLPVLLLIGALMNKKAVGA